MCYLNLLHYLQKNVKQRASDARVSPRPNISCSKPQGACPFLPSLRSEKSIKDTLFSLTTFGNKTIRLYLNFSNLSTSQTYNLVVVLVMGYWSSPSALEQA